MLGDGGADRSSRYLADTKLDRPKPKTLLRQPIRRTARTSSPASSCGGGTASPTVRVPGGDGCSRSRRERRRKLASGRAVLVSVRPDRASAASKPARGDSIAGVVKAVMPLGPHVVFTRSNATSWGTSLKVSEPPRAGQRRCGAPARETRAKWRHRAAGVPRLPQP